ncbi:MAG: hypothetical protein HQ581_26850, partial [Planctomycetes bacterium]|nr:hypothetical protein [Planctomycetota bacterium]
MGKASSRVACFLLLAVATHCTAAERPPVDPAEHVSGLAVQLGCDDGTMTADLTAGGDYLVQSLDAKADNVAKVRRLLRERGLGDVASVELWTNAYLPYADNMVNLLVAKDPGAISDEEILRVLRPGGAAYVQRDSKWTSTAKPYPADIDQWTHYLYDAGGNAVSGDTVAGPPRRV